MSTAKYNPLFAFWLSNCVFCRKKEFKAEFLIAKSQKFCILSLRYIHILAFPPFSVLDYNTLCSEFFYHSIMQRTSEPVIENRLNSTAHDQNMIKTSVVIWLPLLLNGCFSLSFITAITRITGSDSLGTVFLKWYSTDAKRWIFGRYFS